MGVLGWSNTMEKNWPCIQLDGLRRDWTHASHIWSKLDSSTFLNYIIIKTQLTVLSARFSLRPWYCSIFYVATRWKMGLESCFSPQSITQSCLWSYSKRENISYHSQCLLRMFHSLEKEVQREQQLDTVTRNIDWWNEHSSFPVSMDQES